MNLQLNYEKEIAKQRENALNQLQSIIDACRDYKDLPDYLQEKIANQVARFNYDNSMEQAFEECKNSRFLLSYLIKDPVKQSSHQTLAYNHLKKHLPDLKITGPDSLKKLFLTPSGLLTKEQLNGNASKSKSVDFLIEGSQYIYACTHKYTHQSGGAQDNQYHDVLKYLHNAPTHPMHQGKKMKVVAILDGNYYKDKLIKTKEEFPHHWYMIDKIENIIEKIAQLENIELHAEPIKVAQIVKEPYIVPVVEESLIITPSVSVPIATVQQMPLL